MEIETIIQSAFDENGNEKPGYRGFAKYLKNLGINKIIPQPKQTRITFENVDSNILCNDKGEPTMLNLYPLITAENRASVDEIYKTNKNVKVDIIVRWEK